MVVEMGLSRIPYWSEEQLKIQAKFDVQEAKDAIEKLISTISSLKAHGKITAKESSQMKKSLNDMLKKIAETGK